MKIRVFTNPKRNDSIIKEEIENLLLSNGLDIDNDYPDIVLYLGGDGTFLRAVENYIDELDEVKFVGINFGRLGFFYDYQKSDIEKFISDLLSGDFIETTHSLLKADIVSDDKKETVYAINEIRVENPFHTLICDVLINNRTLETFHGNGLLVASSLGSTAYNKSLGGAVVQPTMECLQLTEIAAIQNNYNRSLGSSLILGNKDEISLKGEFRNSVVSYDYQTISNIVLKEITISLSNKKVRVLHPNNYTYIKKLNRSFIQ